MVVVALVDVAIVSDLVRSCMALFRNGFASS